MISPLIKWDHTQNWPVISAKDVLTFGGGIAASTSYTFDPFAPDSKVRTAGILESLIVESGRQL